MSISLDIYLAYTLAGSVTDIGSRRIPNLLTYSAAALVLVSRAYAGRASFGYAVLCLVVTVVVGSVVFGAGWIGGGDIKLMAVGAAAVGYPTFLLVLFYITVAGGFLATCTALRQHRLRETVGNIAFSAATGRPIVPLADSSRIPYALAICAGSFYYAASESIAPWLRVVH